MTSISKGEALATCQTCPKKDKAGCIFADIEGTNSEYIEKVPECLISQLQSGNQFGGRCANLKSQTANSGSPHEPLSANSANQKPNIRQSTKEDAQPKTDGSGSPHEPLSANSNQKSGLPPHVESGLPQGYKQTSKPSWWNEVYEKIIQTIGYPSHGYSQNEIAKQSGIPRTTVKRYLKTLLQKEYVIKAERATGTDSGQRQHVYSLTARCAKLNIYHVDGATDNDSSNMVKTMKVSQHCRTWKTSILVYPKNVPIQAVKYRDGMRGWKNAYTFNNEYEDGRAKFKIIPGNVLLIDFSSEFCDSIPSDTKENLNFKLHDHATSFAGKFAEKYGYRIGTLTPSRCTDEIPLPDIVNKLIEPAGQVTIDTGKAIIEFNKSGKDGKRGAEVSMKNGDVAAQGDTVAMVLQGIANAYELPKILKNHEIDTSNLIEHGNKHLQQNLEQMLAGAIKEMTPVLISAFKAHGEENLKLLLTAITAPHIMQEIAKKQVEDLKETMKKQIEEEMRKMQQTGTTEPDKKMYG